MKLTTFQAGEDDVTMETHEEVVPMTCAFRADGVAVSLIRGGGRFNAAQLHLAPDEAEALAHELIICASRARGGK